MGVCYSYVAERRLHAAEKKRKEEVSLAIDLILEEDKKRLHKECKVLILGASDLCRATLVKHMKVIHQGGFSEVELNAFKKEVYQEALNSAQCLILTMQKMQREFSKPENNVLAELVLKYNVKADPSFTLNPELVDAIDSLYLDPMTATIMDQCRTRQMEFVLYFMSRIRRMGDDTYTPTVQDVLKLRPRANGICETRFHMGHLNIHIFDVGQIGSNRKKWIHCFEGITSIMFCVAIDEYDSVLLEEPRQNSMAESLVLFESVINSRWFLKTSIVLLMTNIDLFAAKLLKVPMEKYFSDYTGGPDVSKAAKYILWRFTQTNRARLHIYPHLAQMSDTLNIRLLFSAVKETILQNALKTSNII